ncbi:MAG: hypothetical protein AAFP89_26410 [Bacteroidota bacterium]
MPNINEEQKENLAQKFSELLTQVKDQAWPENEKFSSQALVTKLNELGFQISSPSFSRISKKDERASVRMYSKVNKALEAFLEMNLKTDLSQDLALAKIPPMLQMEAVESQSKIYPTFPLELVKNAIDTASYEILFLQSFFSFLDEIKENIKTALWNGVRVKILMARPDSHLVAKRMQELGLEQGRQLKAKGDQNVDILAELQRFNENGNLEIQFLHNIGGSLNMIRVDRVIFQGFYWKEKGITEGPFELRPVNSLMGKAMIKHFNDLWKDDETESAGDDIRDAFPTVEKRSLEHKVQQESVTFRSYYYHRLRTRQFIIQLDPIESDSVPKPYQAKILVSESGSQYEGELKFHEMDNSMVMAGMLHETGAGGQCNFAFLSLLLAKDNIDLASRRFIFGTINTQHNQKDMILNSKMVMIRLDKRYNRGEDTKLITLDDLEREVGMSKSFMKMYIQQDYQEVKHNSTSIHDLISEYNDNSLDQRSILKDLAGAYEFFSINKDEYTIRKGYLQIEENSVLWVPGRDTPLNRKSSVERIYQCNVEVIDNDHIFIRTDRVISGMSFYAILKHSSIHPNENILKGTYTGIKRRSPLGASTEPRAGRVLAIRMETKLDKSLIDQHQSTFGHVETYDWFNPKHREELTRKWEQFEDFFSGINNNFIENAKSLISGQNYIHYHPGNLIGDLAGKYYCYYKSSAENERGGIRKLMMEIREDGSALILEKLGAFTNGRVLRYNNHILIHLLQDEGDWHIPRTHEQVPNRASHFKGIISLYISPKEEPEGPTVLTGVILEYSRTKEPLARKVYLLENLDANLKITDAKPMIIPLGRKLEDFPEKEKTILIHLKNDPFYYVKTRKEFDPSHFQQQLKSKFLKQACFWAAVCQAREENINLSLKFLEMAIGFGLTRNDRNLINQLIKKNNQEGPLAPYEQMIDSLFSWISPEEGDKN